MLMVRHKGMRSNDTALPSPVPKMREYFVPVSFSLGRLIDRA